jgi:hypothetical protein
MAEDIRYGEIGSVKEIELIIYGTPALSSLGGSRDE